MKYLRVILTGEPRLWFDHPIPEGSSFATLLAVIRANGYFATTNIYIPLISIHHMIEFEQVTGTVTPGPQLMQ